MMESSHGPQVTFEEQGSLDVGQRLQPLDFRRIYEAEVSHVWTCLRRLGVPERDLEDKTHDVFVVAYRRIDDFDSSRSIRPWLLGIAVRVAADFRRRASYKREVVHSEVERADERLSPEGELEEAEARQILQKLLNRIPEEQRIVFVLHDIEGLSIPQIEQMLDTGVNTLYSRLRLARQQLNADVKRLQLKGGGR